MMFSKGFWTNKNFMDVFFDVTKVQYMDAKRVKLKGYWWNLGWTGNPFLIEPQAEIITIKREHWRDWKRLTDKDLIRFVPKDQ